MRFNQGASHARVADAPHCRADGMEYLFCRACRLDNCDVRVRTRPWNGHGNTPAFDQRRTINRTESRYPNLKSCAQTPLIEAFRTNGSRGCRPLFIITKSAPTTVVGAFLSGNSLQKKVWSVCDEAVIIRNRSVSHGDPRLGTIPGSAASRGSLEWRNFLIRRKRCSHHTFMRDCFAQLLTQSMPLKVSYANAS